MQITARDVSTDSHNSGASEQSMRTPNPKYLSWEHIVTSSGLSGLSLGTAPPTRRKMMDTFYLSTMLQSFTNHLLITGLPGNKNTINAFWVTSRDN
jgi:hypothetical protein